MSTVSIHQKEPSVPPDAQNPSSFPEERALQALAGVPVYTAGYQGHTPLALLTTAARLNAAVVDVRFRPFSHNPAWGLNALKKVFFSRYLSLQPWGNPHYRDGLPIGIHAFERGAQTLGEWLAGTPYTAVILLCQCRDVSTCHRELLAKRLREAGCTVTELQWGQGTVEGRAA